MPVVRMAIPNTTRNQKYARLRFPRRAITSSDRREVQRRSALIHAAPKPRTLRASASPANVNATPIMTAVTETQADTLTAWMRQLVGTKDGFEAS